MKMIRSSVGDIVYWNDAINFQNKEILGYKEHLLLPTGNPAYEPQFIFCIAQEHWHLLLLRYSRGDDISELAQYFLPILEYWEKAEQLGQAVWTDKQQYTRHAWAVNLDHYIVCFWLVGLALALDIPDDQWQRLLVLIGNEGEDELLDRVIASRSPSRRIGNKLCHPKPYQRLLLVLQAQPEQQAKMLADFVKHWYKELNRPPKSKLSEMTAMYDRPYWYTYGNKGLHDSGYFGRWCVEAVAVVKAFGLDDSACLGLEHYPGDLLRPDTSTTHGQRNDVSSVLTKIDDFEPATIKVGWLSKLFGKR